MSALLLIVLTGGGGGLLLDGRVLSVPDGDTLVVLSAGERKRVRLYGVDCPELAQEGGRAAKAAAESLVRWQKVSLRQMDTDPYGRIVAIVTLPDGRVLNDELLAKGQAWVYRVHCRDRRCKDWLAREKTAREASLGLWSADDPTPPWQWRKKHRR